MPRYRVIGEIGRGAMGVVVRAHDAERGRDVALKLLAPQATADPSALARFEHEARALARLDHPGIVKLLDHGVMAGRPFFAMDLLTGQDLFTVATTRSWLPLDEVLGWLVQVAEALAYMHEQGMLHRDVKPSNLMVGDDGRVTLTDFGLVRIQDTQGLTEAGSVVGTLRYMPPEVLVGDKATRAVDIYALGVTLLELASGQPWCRPAKDEDLTARITRGPGPDMKESWPDAPAWLVSLVGYATHRDPATRPSAVEMRDAMRARHVGSGTGVLGPHPGVPPATDPRKRTAPIDPLESRTTDPAKGAAAAWHPERTAALPMPRATWKQKYHVLSKLGRGGMGVVFKALQVELKREVALKCIAPETDPGAAFSERFRREALAMSRVSHPGLIKVFDVSEEGAEPYIAMELVSGRTLEAEVLSEPLEVRRTADQTFLLLLEAVAALHAAGLAHRDLKPTNIMITTEKRPIVMDLGLVKDFEGNWTNLTRTGSMIGTPAYLAPEIFAGKDSATQADVWALGAIYYLLNSGEPPFKARSMDQLYHAIARDALPDFSVGCPDMPASRRVFLATLLERDLEKRPKDAARALDLFRRVLSGRSISGGQSRPRAITSNSGTSAPPSAGARLNARRSASALVVGLAIGMLGIAWKMGGPGGPAVRPSAITSALTGAHAGASLTGGAGNPGPSGAPVSGDPRSRVGRGDANPIARMHRNLRPMLTLWDNYVSELPRLRAGGAIGKAAVRALNRRGGLVLANDPKAWTFYLSLGAWLADPRRPWAPANVEPSDEMVVQQELLSSQTWNVERPAHRVALTALASIELAPGEGCGWLLLGLALEDEGRPDLAVTAYQRGLKLLEGTKLSRAGSLAIFKGLARALLTVPTFKLERDWPRYMDADQGSWRAWRGLQLAWDKPDRTRIRSMLAEAAKRASVLGEVVTAIALDIDEWDHDAGAVERTLNAAREPEHGGAAVIARSDFWMRRGRIDRAHQGTQAQAWMPLGRPAVPATAEWLKLVEGRLTLAQRYTMTAELNDREVTRKLARSSASEGTLPDVACWGDDIRQGDAPPEIVSACRSLVQTGEPTYAELEMLAGRLSAPAAAPWFGPALEASAARPDAAPCNRVALALWHARSGRHDAALDELERVRADPHVTAVHAVALLEVACRARWAVGPGSGEALAARLPAPDAPPGNPYPQAASYWRALALGRPPVTLEAARVCLERAPDAFTVAAVARAAAAHPDPAVAAAGLDSARIVVRTNALGPWLIEEIERLAKKVPSPAK